MFRPPLAERALFNKDSETAPRAMSCAYDNIFDLRVFIKKESSGASSLVLSPFFSQCLGKKNKKH